MVSPRVVRTSGERSSYYYAGNLALRQHFDAGKDWARGGLPSRESRAALGALLGAYCLSRANVLVAISSLQHNPRTIAGSEEAARASPTVPETRALRISQRSSRRALARAIAALKGSSCLGAV